ncbi:contractile injection system protein, VgrG/Pvc8 family [Psychrobacter aestuarii]|uniref:Type VI secretion system tip protein VgrG n=1 Tax=Psychrobacter aestuarii TaxID=556327 RepID=A0ABP3FBZ1_9GAMM|nr:contractile injection system protein, VgrG/Pvc8 family [Psychrobacter aestuarii]
MLLKDTKLHYLDIKHDTLAADVFAPVAFISTHEVNAHQSTDILVFSYEFLDRIDCLSIVGSQVCLSTRAAAYIPVTRTGIVRGVHYQYSDGALHFYQLSVVSPEWLLTQSVHTRSFYDQSCLDIATSVLSGYDFTWEVGDALAAVDVLHQSYPLRTQLNMSDWEFLTGLFADLGVMFYWVAAPDVDTLGYWRITHTMDSNEQGLIYTYGHASVQSGQDTLEDMQYIAKRLGAQQVTVRADGLAADTVFEGSASDDGELNDGESIILLATPSRVTNDDMASALATQWVAANKAHREAHYISGGLREMAVGQHVSIQIPYMGNNLSGYCLRAQILGIEPDDDSVSYQHQSMIETWLDSVTRQQPIPKHAYQSARHSGIWVSAKLLNDTIPYTPYPSPQAFAHRHYQGLIQARTGQSADPSYQAPVTTDGLHQSITTPAYSGISEHDAGRTPPLRQLQLSSGSTHGWQFAARDGQPVLLNHWYGDTDSPIIQRALYDGIGMGDNDERDITVSSMNPAHRHNTQGGVSPRWHGAGLGHSQVNDDDGHSGWVSGIAQYGLSAATETWLGFDDTPNRLGIQWSVNTEARANATDPNNSSIASYSPQQHSIELGVLRHRFSNHQAAESGQGFKVVTDNSLQLTAQQGVLLSTFGIRHSQTEHESAWVNDAGQQQLKISTELSTTYQDAKQAHLQDPSALQAATSVTDRFKTAAQIMDERLNTEVMGAADVLMVSRDSIYSAASNTLASAHTIIRQSGSTQSDMIAGNSRMAADSISSLSGVGGQAEKSGWHMSANTGALAIQAQGGELQLHSQAAMTIGSEAGQVNLASPKRIKLQTKGGASITIDDSGVKLVCPGEIKVKAVKKSLVAGMKANYALPMMPETIPLFSNKFDVYDLFYQYDFKDIEFQIRRPDGQLIEGVLDEHGRTAPVISDKEEEVEVLIGFKDADWGLSYIPEDDSDESVSST